MLKNIISIVRRCVITVTIIVSTVAGQDYPFYPVNDTTRLNDTIFLDHFSYVLTYIRHNITLGDITLRGGPLTSAEDFEDVNQNGAYDHGEPFTDFNNNGLRDNADEMGIFCAWEDTVSNEPSDSLFCVGADYIDIANLPWGMNVDAWKDDDAPDSPEQDGYISGYPINYRFWDASIEAEVEIDSTEVSYVEFLFWDTTGNFHSQNMISGINMKVDSPQYYQYTETHDNPQLFILNEPLEQGTEIGIYTQDSICVGGSVLTGESGQMFYAWKDDPDTPDQDGFVNGDTIVLYLNFDGEETGPINVEFVEYSVVVDGDTVEWNTTGLFQEEAISGIRLMSPTISTIPVEPILEDAGSFDPINLDNFVTDPDDDISELTWSYSYLDTILGVNIDNNNIVIVDVLIENWHGSEIVTFTAADPSGGTGSRDVTFTVIPVNDSLYVENPIDDVTIDEDSPSSFLVDLDDVFEDVDDSTFTFGTPTNDNPGLLFVELNEGSEVTLFIEPDSFGVALLTFSASDTQYTATDSVLITVNPVNDAPTAEDGSAEVNEDNTVWIPLDVSDIDGDELSFIISVLPENGTVDTLVSDSARYIPYTNYNGSDIFSFKAYDDGGLYSEEATVTVTIHPVNDPPIALDDAYGTSDTLDTQEEGLPGVLGNDSDVDSEFLIAQIIEGADSGTVDLEQDGSFTYIPDTSFFGTDFFTYVAIDDNSTQSDTAIVQITVSQQVIVSPIVEPDFYSTNEDEPLSILSYDYGVLANDSDTSGVDTLSAQLSQPTSNGNLNFNSDGTFFYRPNVNYFGVDTFYYRAFNGFLYSDSVEVTITVEPVNDAPIATGFLVETEENISVTLDFSGNVTDPETPSDSLEYHILILPIHGNMVDNVYYPDTSFYGEDSLTYIAIDEESLQSEPAKVRLKVEQVIIEPIANAGIDIQESVSFPYDPISITLDGSQSTDEDGYIVSYQWFEEEIQIGSGANPSIYFLYGDHFVQLVVTDDEDTTGVDTVFVSVTPEPNQSPEAEDIEVVIDEDENISITLVGSDFETPNELVFSIVDGPPNGTLSESRALDVVTYSPRLDYFGTDTFTYSVEDDSIYWPSEFDTSTVVIIINPVNDAPELIFENPEITLDENTSIDIPYEMSDDADGADASPLEFVVVNNPLHGQITVDTVESELNYTPEPNYFGYDNCIVKTVETIGDSLNSIPVQLIFTVNDVNEPPIAYGYSYTLPEDSETFSFFLQASDDEDVFELLYDVIDSPDSGELNSEENNQVEYTPNPDFDGVDSLVFSVTDHDGESDTAVVTFNMIPINDAPTAQSATFDAHLNDTFSFDVSEYGSDIDTPDDSLIFDFILSGGALGGSISLDGTLLTYSQANNAFNYDYIPYRVSDGDLNSSIAVFTIDNLTGEVRENRAAPVATGDSITVTFGEEFIIEFIGTDITFPFQEVSIDTVGGPSRGTLTNFNFNSFETLVTTYTGIYTPTSTGRNNDGQNRDDPEFTIDITASDGINSTVLKFGMSPGATDGFDEGLDEYAPPAPPSGFDVALSWNSDRYYTQILDPSTAETTMPIAVSELYSFTWDPAAISAAGTFTLTDNFGGAFLSIDMSTTGSVDESSTPLWSNISTFFITFTASEPPSSQIYGCTDSAALNYGYNCDDEDVGDPTDDDGCCEYDASATLQDSIVFQVSNGDGDDTGVIHITIEPATLPPELAAVGTQTIDEDNLEPINIGFSDIDSDVNNLIFEISSLPGIDWETFGISILNDSTAILNLQAAENETGNALITVSVTDELDQSDEIQFQVIVRNVNDPPILTSIGDQEVNEDNSIFIPLQYDDIDTDLNSLTFDLTVDPIDGMHANVFLPGYELLIEPSLDFFGEIAATVKVNDGEYEVSQDFTLTVLPDNDSPELFGIVDFDIDEDTDTTLVFTPIDVDGDSIDIVITLGDTALFDPDSFADTTVLAGEDVDILFQPKPNQNGSVDVVITGSDGSVEVVRNFVVTVIPTDDPPVAYAGSDDLLLSYHPWDPIIHQLSADSSEDSDGYIAAYVWEDNGNEIGVGINPEVGLAIGVHTINLTVTDNDTLQSSDTVVVTVSGIPHAQDIVKVINEGSSTEFTLSGEDGEEDPLDIEIIIFPEDGELIGDIPVFEYVPDAEFSGSDTLIFSVSDGAYADTGLVEIIVTPLNDTPVVNDIDIPTDEDTPIEIILTGSDVDGDDLSFPVLIPPQHGVYEDSLYTPDQDYFGNDSFTYRAFDGQVYSDIAVVTITINSVNDAPEIADIVDQSVLEDLLFTYILSATDVDGDEITFLAEVDSNATASVDGVELTVSPDADFNGEIAVTVTVYDSDLSDTTIFTLQVDPVNDIPLVNDLDFEIDEDTPVDIILTGSDVDGDTLTIDVVVGPSFGIYADDVYTPDLNYNGSDSITYHAYDGQIYSDTATVSININEINDPVVVSSPMIDITVDEDAAVVIHADLDSVFSDVDDPVLSFSFDNSNTSLLTASIDDENVLRFEFLENAFGSAVITVTASDGEFNISDDVSVIVNSVNDIPLVDDLDIITDEDTHVDVTLTGFDVETPDDSLTFEIVAEPIHGVYSDGVYTPNENYFGDDSLTYRAYDNQDYSDTAIVIITVNSVNDIPLVDDLDIITDEDTHVDVTLTGFDVETPDDSLTFEIVAEPIHGVYSDGVYTPNENYFGDDSFTFRAFDDQDYSSDATVTLTINPVNDPVEVQNPLFDYDVTISSDFETIIGDLDDVFYDVENDNDLDFTYVMSGSPLTVSVDTANQIIFSFETVYAWDSDDQSIVQEPQFIGETEVIFTATEPDGEYSISNTIMVKDSIPPNFIVGVFQNPLASGHLEFYFFHSETLDTNPTAQLSGNELTVVRHQGSEWGEDAPYYADYVSTETGDLSLSVTATDTIGNTGSTVYNFFVQPVSGRMASTFSSFEDHFVINISENTFINDDQILLLPNDFMAIFRYGLEEELTENLIGNILTIRSQQTNYGDKMAVGMHDENMDELLAQSPGFYRLEYGHWEYMETYYSVTEQKIWCLTEKPGTYVLRSEADRTPIEMPDKFALNQNYPNPFNPATTIVFDIPQEMFDRIEVDTRLVIYDLLGREIRTLVDRKMLSGRHKIIWNGKNNHGLNVASGIYFYRLNTHEFMQTNKMILLR